MRILLGFLLVALSGATLFSQRGAAAPATSATLATAASVAPILPPAPGPDETYVEFVTRATEATTASLITTGTVSLAEGLSTSTAATTVPAWLIGPTTGTVMGCPLPLSLGDSVKLGLAHNFQLQSSQRDVQIARSEYVVEQYEFVPFLNLFSGYTYTDRKTGLEEGDGIERTVTQKGEVGASVKQNFPTGGSIVVEQNVSRARVWEQSRVERVDSVTGRVSGVSHPSNVVYGWENTLDVAARQPLLRGGGLTVGLANLRLSRLSEIEAEVSDQIRRRDLVLAVIRAYFSILQRQLDARISLDAIREKRRFYDETIIKHELGEIAESEIWRAKIQWLQEQSRALQLAQAFLDSLDTLMLLTGLPIDTPFRLREFTGQITDLKTLGLSDSDSCVRVGLANRPEIILADIRLRQAEINVDVAKNGVLPFLNLEATYSDTEVGEHLRDVQDPSERRTWSLGALFDLPIPNMGQRQALRQVRLRLEKARIARQSIENDVTEEVRRLHRALLTNEDRVRVLAETVTLAEKSLQLENARFYYGENTSTEVRQAQDDLFQARTDYNNAKLRYQSDLASLYRAIGLPFYQDVAMESAAVGPK